MSELRLLVALILGHALSLSPPPPLLLLCYVGPADNTLLVFILFLSCVAVCFTQSRKGGLGLIPLQSYCYIYALAY